MMNSTGVHSKRSSLEKRLDRLIFCIFAMLAAICLVDAIGSALWVNKVPLLGGCTLAAGCNCQWTDGVTLLPRTSLRLYTRLPPTSLRQCTSQRCGGDAAMRLSRHIHLRAHMLAVRSSGTRWLAGRVTLRMSWMQRHWYLRMGSGSESSIARLLFDPDSRAIVGILDFLTLFILYSSLILIRCTYPSRSSSFSRRAKVVLSRHIFVGISESASMREPVVPICQLMNDHGY